MKKFFATALKCYEEDEVLTIALGDDAENPSNFLIFTRLDDEESASVDDCIGLQTDKAKCEMSGAIDRVLLHLDSLEVVVKPEFAGLFGDSSIIAEFSSQDNELSISYLVLKKALQKIFSGSKVDLIVWLDKPPIT